MRDSNESSDFGSKKLSARSSIRSVIEYLQAEDQRCNVGSIEESSELFELEESEEDIPHYLGHRQRLRQKVFNEKCDGLADYELVELLLFTAIPRRDVKPLAKKLIKNFKGLSGLLNAGQDKLLAIEGVNSNVYVHLLMVREFISRVLRQKVINHNVISCWSDLLDYLKMTMGGLKIEQFRVLFLNKQNILIEDEVMTVGTVDQAVVYPREIVKRALFHDATAVILAHNHPSGTAKPSKADIELTRKIKEICSNLSISVHDHVIITGAEYYSFKSNMLL